MAFQVGNRGMSMSNTTADITDIKNQSYFSAITSSWGDSIQSFKSAYVNYFDDSPTMTAEQVSKKSKGLLEGEMTEAIYNQKLKSTTNNAQQFVRLNSAERGSSDGFVELSAFLANSFFTIDNLVIAGIGVLTRSPAAVSATARLFGKSNKTFKIGDYRKMTPFQYHASSNFALNTAYHVGVTIPAAKTEGREITPLDTGLEIGLGTVFGTALGVGGQKLGGVFRKKQFNKLKKEVFREGETGSYLESKRLQSKLSETGELLETVRANSVVIDNKKMSLIARSDPYVRYAGSEPTFRKEVNQNFHKLLSGEKGITPEANKRINKLAEDIDDDTLNLDDLNDTEARVFDKVLKNYHSKNSKELFVEMKDYINNRPLISYDERAKTYKEQIEAAETAAKETKSVEVGTKESKGSKETKGANETKGSKKTKGSKESKGSKDNIEKVEHVERVKRYLSNEAEAYDKLVTETNIRNKILTDCEG